MFDNAVHLRRDDRRFLCFMIAGLAARRAIHLGRKTYAIPRRPDTIGYERRRSSAVTGENWTESPAPAAELTQTLPAPLWAQQAGSSRMPHKLPVARYRYGVITRFMPVAKPELRYDVISPPSVRRAKDSSSAISDRTKRLNSRVSDTERTAPHSTPA